MKDTSFFEKIKKYIFYGGIDKKEFKQIHSQVAAANLKLLRYWSVLVSVFWIYCIIMSFFAKDYEMCRPAYIVSLCSCIVSFFLLQVFGAEIPEDTSLVQILFPPDAARRRNRDSCLPVEPALTDIVRGRDNLTFDFYWHHGVISGSPLLSPCALYPFG